MISMKSIKDFNIKWDIEEISNLKWEFVEGYGVNEAFLKYSDINYKNTLHNYKYFYPNPMPKFTDEILKLPMFDKWDNILIGFTLLTPGQVLPLHYDTYTRTKNVFHLNESHSITRFVIFLEDSKDGHMFEIEDTIIKKWKRFDYVSWTDKTLHGAYNLGTENRYTLQVTCI